MRTISFFAVLLFAGAAALGTTTVPKQVTCPVCKEEITVLAISSTNSFGGPDYDLCTHARGEEPRTLRVWTCPHCWYSRIGGRFEKEVSTELADRVRKELRPPVPLIGVTDQRKIPAWVKYRLAAQVLEWEGAPALERAHLYLEGAWSLRSDTGWPGGGLYFLQATYPALWEQLAERQRDMPPPDVFRAFVPCETELQLAGSLLEIASGEKDPAREAGLRLIAASLFRGRGENLLATPILAALAGGEDVQEVVVEAARALLRGIEREQWFQERWLSVLAEMLGDPQRKGEEIQDQERATLFYIAGDTCRRLGRDDEAAEWFRRSLKVEGAPAIYFEIARTALGKLGVSAGDSKGVAEAREKRLKELIARLNDPEAASSARDEIRALRDPALEPGVVAALGSEHSEVRTYAALALMELPEPSDAAVDALCRLLEDEEGDPRLTAAVALSRIAAVRSRAALEQALDAEKDEIVRESLIKALGLVGTEVSLPALLSAWDRGPRILSDDLREAVSRIGFIAVPEEIESGAELEAWWKEHRTGVRSDWLCAGFKAAGVEIEEPWDRKDIPALLELLSHEDALVRCNAVRLLREITGRRLPLYEIARDSNSNRSRQRRTAAIAEWRRWWEESRGK